MAAFEFNRFFVCADTGGFHPGSNNRVPAIFYAAVPFIKPDAGHNGLAYSIAGHPSVCPLCRFLQSSAANRLGTCIHPVGTYDGIGANDLFLLAIS